jgi:formiminotetrahydrofolate cyclodeaminase
VRSSASPDLRGQHETSHEALFGLPFEEILRRTAERTAYAGGGAVSAMACASAASLVAMAARFTGEAAVLALTDAEAAIVELRGLADADADAFGELLVAWKLPADRPDRAERVAAAASRACAVPLRVCEIGARLAEHAACLAAEGKHDLVGDALTAGYLAQAGVRGSARLVEINARQATDRAPAETARAAVARTREAVELMERKAQ